jgi:uncharacterized protein
VKVVFDTNILVSAVVFPGGRAESALVRIIEEHDQLFISRAVLDELLGVLARKFSKDPEELARLALLLSDIAVTVRPRARLRVVKDDPDNRVLECAVTARADLWVTGDKELLALREYRGVRIVSLRDYIQDA